MKTLIELESSIAENPAGYVVTNGFRPVIVVTEYCKNNTHYGVQFWSDFLITKGQSRNSDGTLAKFVKLI
jgi:hypothetical protein